MADSDVLNYLITSRKSKSGSSPDEVASLLSAGASQMALLSTYTLKTAAGEMCIEIIDTIDKLLSNKNPAPKAEGLRLAAVVASHCSVQQFLSKYVDWAASALAFLRDSNSSVAWDLLQIIFNRVGPLLDVTGVRREAATLVPRLGALFTRSKSTSDKQEQNQPDLENDIPISGLPTLQSALIALPTAFRQHLKALEPVVIDALLSHGAAPDMRSAAAGCLSALPRVIGDAEAWSSASQRLLATAHVLLDAAFLGMEDQNLAAACKQAIDPGSLPLVPLEGSTGSNGYGGSSLESYTAVFWQLHGVLSCLDLMLKRSYPVPVPVPGVGMVMLMTRVLSMDDATAAGKSGFAASSGKLAHLWLHLPSLHCIALRLLCTVSQITGSQAVTFLGPALRILSSRLSLTAAGGAGARVGFDAATRTELYHCTQTLLQVGGLASVKSLSPTLIPCLEAELYHANTAAGAAGVYNSMQGGGGGGGSKSKKKSRKTSTTKSVKPIDVSSDDDEEDDVDATDASGLHKNKRRKVMSAIALGDFGVVGAVHELSAQAAALSCCEALLLKGSGSLIPGDRSKLEAIAMHMSLSSHQLSDRLSGTGEAPATVIKPVQVAAYKALLAAVLAPAQHRPRYLPAAVQLYSVGQRERYKPLADFCSQALLCIEGLLHPRSRAVMSQPSIAVTAGTYGVVATQPSSASLAPVISLGMPKLWSCLDLDATLQVRSLEITLQQHQQQLEDEAERPQQKEDKNKAVASQQQQHQQQSIAALGGLQMNPAKAMDIAAPPRQHQQQQLPVFMKPAPPLNINKQSKSQAALIVTAAHPTENAATHLDTTTAGTAGTSSGGTLAALQQDQGHDHVMGDVDGTEEDDEHLPEIDSGNDSSSEEEESD